MKRHRVNRDEGGFTVIELSVSMLVTTVLLASVAMVFAGTLRTVNTLNVKISTTADARIAMDAVTRTLRVAYQPAGETSALVSASGAALSFYALVNRSGTNTSQTLPALIEYSWNGTCLIEARTPGRTLAIPSGTGSLYAWDTGRTTTCLARTSLAPAFDYFTTGTATTALSIPTGGLTLAARQSVVSVQVSVTVRDPRNPSIGAIPMTNRITLINVQTAAGG